jgi:hypothetical protein
MKQQIEKQNRSHVQISVSRLVRLVGLVCGLLPALSSAAVAQYELRPHAGAEPPNIEGERALSLEGDPFNPTGFEGEFHTATIETAYGPRIVSYQVLDASTYGLEENLAVFEGDIVLGTVMLREKGAPFLYSTGRTNTSFRWPNGVVPYEIDAAYTTAERPLITAALDHWNAVTPYWFRPRNGENDFIRFVRVTGVCNSLVGRQGGRQVINLDAVGCGTGGAIHEIGHAIGLWHEQSRADRNNFVTINWANIQNGQASNFQTYIQQGQDGRDMFDYDFGSIMHYGSFAFAIRDAMGRLQPTITRLDGTLINNNTTALSQGDIAGAVRELTNTQPQPTFMIVNVNSGKCLDVANWSRSNGAAVNQFDCHGGANQRWYTWQVPGTNKSLVINDWSGQCLDIPGGSLADGAPLQQFSCHGFGNQQFGISFTFPFFGFQFQNANSGKCLDVPDASTASGVRVQQFTCHSGLNQQWMFLP